MKMIKRYFDNPQELRFYKDEKILKVIFLLEKKPSTAYYLPAVLIITNIAAYVSPRGRYTLQAESEAVKVLLGKIINQSTHFLNSNDYIVFCIEENILRYVENKDEFLIDLEKIKASDCPKNEEFEATIKNICETKLKSYLGKN